MSRIHSLLAGVAALGLLAPLGVAAQEAAPVTITKLSRDRLQLFETATAPDPCGSVETAAWVASGSGARIDRSDTSLGKITEIGVPGRQARYDEENEMIEIELADGESTQTFWFQSAFATFPRAVSLPACPEIAADDVQAAAIRGMGEKKCR